MAVVSMKGPRYKPSTGPTSPIFLTSRGEGKQGLLKLIPCGEGEGSLALGA